jgi:hypothetical protein
LPLLPAASPANPLRVAAKTNDLRGWTPANPVLLCGGNGDPTAFFSVNTGVMAALWAGLPNGLPTVLDVDSAVAGPADPFAAAKVGFANAKAGVIASAGANAAVALTSAYHGTLVPPYCNAAARGFFARF